MAGFGGIDLVGLANQNNAENERIAEENRQKAKNLADKIKEMPEGAVRQSLLETLEKQGNMDPASMSEGDFDRLRQKIHRDPNLSPRDKQQKIQWLERERAGKFGYQENEAKHGEEEKTDDVEKFDPSQMTQGLGAKKDLEMHKIWKDL